MQLPPYRVLVPDTGNIHAANKAFIVTRVGDTALAIGSDPSFSYSSTHSASRKSWPGRRYSGRAAPKRPLGSASSPRRRGGKIGAASSADLAPDAMAGPEPGERPYPCGNHGHRGVYLIARTHVIFTLAPARAAAVALIGAATLLLASASALVQSDIKRVLAWSTISQIG